METLRRRLIGRDPLFRDREDAGGHLAAALAKYRGQDALVLGIPRGGVPVAAEVARRLEAELDVVVARKLGAPLQPELAMGAVTANGGLFVDDEIVAEIGVDQDELNRVIARERAEAKARERRFRGERPPPRIARRTVIVVDDGLATGATMRAAVHAVRGDGPARLVAAVPVGSGYARDALAEEVDEVVCLHAPEPFWAVGLYYANFAPVEDAEVQRILQEYRAAAPPAAVGAG
jgi:putative phosphoribosyl transferase